MNGANWWPIYRFVPAYPVFVASPEPRRGGTTAPGTGAATTVLVTALVTVAFVTAARHRAMRASLPRHQHFTD